jgi:hypothetical protein
VPSGEGTPLEKAKLEAESNNERDIQKLLKDLQKGMPGGQKFTVYGKDDIEKLAKEVKAGNGGGKKASADAKDEL